MLFKSGSDNVTIPSFPNTSILLATAFSPRSRQISAQRRVAPAMVRDFSMIETYPEFPKDDISTKTSYIGSNIVTITPKNTIAAAMDTGSANSSFVFLIIKATPRKAIMSFMISISNIEGGAYQ